MNTTSLSMVTLSIEEAFIIFSESYKSHEDLCFEATRHILGQRFILTKEKFLQKPREYLYHVRKQMVESCPWLMKSTKYIAENSTGEWTEELKEACKEMWSLYNFPRKLVIHVQHS